MAGDDIEFHLSPGRHEKQGYRGTADTAIIDDRIDSIALDVKTWANKVFPGRTDGSMALKLYQEIGEMIESNGDPSEIADVFIMLLDYAERKGVRIGDAIRAKMVINRQRQWKINESTGVMSHVKE